MFMSAIALALISAMCYGAADFLGGLATKRATMLAVALGGQLTGLVVLVPLAVLFTGHVRVSDIAFGLAAGVCGGLGIALLYHALAIGKMGVVSPVTAVLAAAIPVAAGFARGEHLSTLQWAGIGVALIAIVLISFSTEEDGAREIATAGLREAIASGVLLGLFLLVLAFVHPSAGLAGLLAARCSSVLALALAALAVRANVRPTGGTLPLVVFSGLLDGSGVALYVLALRLGDMSIAAVLTSLYPAATVLLALGVLRERLQRSQYAGMALALAGVVLIAL